MDDKTEAFVAFSHFLGIGPIKFQAIKKTFKSVDQAYTSDLTKLSKAIGLNLASQFIDFRKDFNIKDLTKKFKDKNIKVIHQEDKLFPKNLLNIADPPICIYVKGYYEKFDFDDRFVSVVGTRMPTSYGQRVTRDIVYSLVGSGYKIVSGLALGIDAIAHNAAIEIGGLTVAFLGCGVDVVYPYSNSRLYELILKTKGLIISEFPPGMTVLKGLFVARNRLISALSKSVIIVEGSDKSGALITAKYAAEQGKDVYAVPGNITSKMSQAPNILIKEGAKPIISLDYISQEFNLRKRKTIEKIDKRNLNNLEKSLINILENEPKGIDEILELVKKDISLILQALTGLELKGYIIKNSEGKYEFN